MNVAIGAKVHAPSGMITACGCLISDQMKSVESEVTCQACVKSSKTLIDPDSIKIPALVFGKPETGDQFVEATKTIKVATKSRNRVVARHNLIRLKVSEIRTSLNSATLANRCPCGKFPWEHGAEDVCGPRNSGRRVKLFRLYLRRPHRTLDGSNTLVRMAVAQVREKV